MSNGTGQPHRFMRARQLMVEQQLKARGVTDPRVLDVMGRVPREHFVGEALAPQAYNDSALPIGEKQTISQPFIVGRMSEALQLRGHETVLEIGTGSGYQTAVLSSLAARVYTVERVVSLGGSARRLLEGLGCRNVVMRIGDGTLGWREFAPFEAILVTAAGPAVPSVLLEQLADGGRLVIPVGGERDQRLCRYVRIGERFQEEDLGPVRFVPLVGRFGWKKESLSP